MMEISNSVDPLWISYFVYLIKLSPCVGRKMQDGQEDS